MVDEPRLLMVVVVLRLSVVLLGRAIGLLATKGIPLRIAADREKGRASWRQAGLPAQSLRRHRFRRALRAFGDWKWGLFQLVHG